MNNRFGRKNHFNNANRFEEYDPNDLNYIISKYSESFEELNHSNCKRNSSIQSDNLKNVNVNNSPNTKYADSNSYYTNSNIHDNSTTKFGSNVFLRNSNEFNHNNSNYCNSERKMIYRLSELEDNNLYVILKVNENDSIETIKKSYKKLCIQHHPNKGGNPEYFRRISEAFRILSNTTLRMLYNDYGYKMLEYLRLDNDFNGGSNCEIDIEFLRSIIECS